MKKSLDRVIEFAFYLLFFLVPLILTPWNYELFEFNKMMLTYCLAVVILSAWLMRMVLEKKLIFRRTLLDLPLILFLLSQLISTIYSLDQHTSLWGYYSRFNGGLFSTLTFILLYWAFVANMNKEKTLLSIRYLLYTTALVSLYGLAEHFGIDAQYWVQDVQRRVFSTLGQPNWLAAWLVALLPLAWALAFTQEKLFQKKQLVLLGYLFSSLLYLCLLYTKSRSGFIGFAFAYAAFWGLVLIFHRQKIKEILKRLVILNLILLVISLLVGTPWTFSVREVTQKIKPQPETTISTETELPPLITESGEIRQIVWQGAIDIWKNHPFFGTGVETFAYAYYEYRPRAHNDVSEWDFLYNKAHNEYLTILANTGLAGLITYLGFISLFLFWTLKQIIKKKAKDYLLTALFAGYLSLLVTDFFGFSVVATSLLFFLIPALVFTLVSEPKPQTEVKKEKEIETKQWLVMLVIACLGLFLLLQLAQIWYADTRFALAEKLNQSAWYEKASQELQTAIRLRPDEPYFHNEMATALAGIATLEKEASLAGQLAETAISQSDIALKTSPAHLNFWKNRAKMLISLSSLDPQYQQAALSVLLHTAEMAPTDAKIFYNLGLLYVYLGQKGTAMETLEKTIELKPNYTQARYQLAQLYLEKGEKLKAREQLEYILEKIDKDNLEAKELLNQIK